MQIFRCRLCGESYVGKEKPSSCPFCGAHANLFIFGKDWKDENVGLKLTEISRKNLEKTLELEISNATFYKCCFKNAKDPEVAAMFKSLSKMEAEHADVACKLLGIKNSEEAKKMGVCGQEDLTNLIDSKAREERAINFYKQFLEEAIEPRVKFVFGALIQIEEDHLAIGSEEVSKLS